MLNLAFSCKNIGLKSLKKKNLNNLGKSAVVAAMDTDGIAQVENVLSLFLQHLPAAGK